MIKPYVVPFGVTMSMTSTLLLLGIIMNIVSLYEPAASCRSSVGMTSGHFDSCFRALSL